jgi:hypothetical protein
MSGNIYSDMIVAIVVNTCILFLIAVYLQVKKVRARIVFMDDIE